jgi:hypothetical protein
MRRSRFSLEAHERPVFEHTVQVILNRLAHKGTIEWAIGLDHRKAGERHAILFALGHPDNANLKEPWRSAWGLIAEAFESGIVDEIDLDMLEYDAAQGIERSDRSVSVINAFVNFVRPRLKIEKISNWYKKSSTEKKRPTRWADLFSATLTSGRPQGALKTAISACNDSALLEALARNLMTAAQDGMNIGRKIGWDGKRDWRLGSLNRVYYIEGQDSESNPNDPDFFHEGIAPCIKMLHAVVAQLIVVDPPKSHPFIRVLSNAETSIEKRVWAALARSEHVADGWEVGEFLAALSREEFWDTKHKNPEFVELMAVRFKDLGSEHQKKVLKRVRKGPLLSTWSKREVSGDELMRIRDYWIARELKRITLGGGSISPADQDWLAQNTDRFPDIKSMNQIENGFLGGPEVHWVPPKPDEQYNTITGQIRLEKLELELVKGWQAGRDGPNAFDWMREGENSIRVITDLENATKSFNKFPHVWNELGETIRQKSDGTDEAFATHFLALISVLENETLFIAHKGISNWLEHWRFVLKASKTLHKFWLQFWPIVLAAYETEEELADLEDSEEGDRIVSRMLITPIGNMVRVFSTCCPNLEDVPSPFKSGTLGEMRDALRFAQGKPLAITRHSLLLDISYFFAADERWAVGFLIKPLLADEDEVLWRSVATAHLSPKVLKLIGEKLVEKSSDSSLPRKTRQKFAARLLEDVLHAYREKKYPVIERSLVTQMLRRIDNEVRAHAAGRISRHIKYWTGQDGKEKPPKGKIWDAGPYFQSVVNPLIADIWPKDLHLITPAISKSFASIPGLSGSSFIEALDLMERYLLPFECWSLYDYSLKTTSGDQLERVITSADEANALLRLFDLTVGQGTNSVVPYDLPTALGHIKKIAPLAAATPIFRRLSAQVR